MRGLAVPAVAMIVLMVIFLVVVVAFGVPVIQKAFAEILGQGKIFQETPFSDAIRLSHLRCSQGCDALDGEERYDELCKNVPTDFKPTDGKICDWNALQYPITIEKGGVNPSVEYVAGSFNVDPQFSCVFPTGLQPFDPGKGFDKLLNFLIIEKDSYVGPTKSGDCTGQTGALDKFKMKNPTDSYYIFTMKTSANTGAGYFVAAALVAGTVVGILVAPPTALATIPALYAALPTAATIITVGAAASGTLVTMGVLFPAKDAYWTIVSPYRPYEVLVQNQPMIFADTSDRLSTYHRMVVQKTDGTKTDYEFSVGYTSISSGEGSVTFLPSKVIMKSPNGEVKTADNLQKGQQYTLEMSNGDKFVIKYLDIKVKLYGLLVVAQPVFEITYKV